MGKSRQRNRTGGSTPKRTPKKPNLNRSREGQPTVEAFFRPQDLSVSVGFKSKRLMVDGYRFDGYRFDGFRLMFLRFGSARAPRDATASPLKIWCSIPPSLGS